MISVEDVAQGEPIREAAFFNAVLRIWLGPNPADRKPKDALLGELVLGRPAQRQTRGARYRRN